MCGRAQVVSAGSPAILLRVLGALAKEAAVDGAAPPPAAAAGAAEAASKAAAAAKAAKKGAEAKAKAEAAEAEAEAAAAIAAAAAVAVANFKQAPSPELAAAGASDDESHADGEERIGYGAVTVVAPEEEAFANAEIAASEAVLAADEASKEAAAAAALASSSSGALSIEGLRRAIGEGSALLFATCLREKAVRTECLSAGGASTLVTLARHGTEAVRRTYPIRPR